MNDNHRNPLTGIALLLTGLSMVLVVVLIASQTARAASIRYAAPTAQGSGDCSSWDNACTLPTALAGASSGDEIWVQAGVHYPGGLITDTFTLQSGVALYGGFVGTETARDQRNWQTNPTVLSGDIDHNDITDPTGVVTTTAGIVGMNSYHVVTSSGVTETAVLDGFFITAGQANAPGHSYQECNGHYCGGGMFNNNSSPTLTNIIFSGNLADYYGGGMYNGDSSPTLTNVTFSGNSAGADGGGMFNSESSPTLTNVAFSSNTALDGGGIYNTGTLLVAHSTFSDNSVTYSGGGIYNNGTLTVTNSTFSGNSGTTYGASFGGGISNFGTLTIKNSKLSGNSATYGGGISTFGMLRVTNSMLSGNHADYGSGINNYGALTVTNCTLAGNFAANWGAGIYNNTTSAPFIQNSIFWNVADTGAQIVYTPSSPSPVIRKSLVRGCNPGGIWNSACGTDGGNNLPDTDPLFVDPQPASGAPTTAGDYRLQDNSPAINMGDNAADLDGSGPLTATISSILVDLNGHPRFVRVFVDLGAYENQAFPCPAGGVLYVDQDAAGLQTGASWADALTTLQDALQVTEACEIWVAEGAYYPDQGGSQAEDDRRATFALKSGVAVYGGFAGTETSRDQRSWTANVTVLSGDIDGNDLTDPSGVVTDTAHITGTNSYHVITDSGSDGTATLDGFFITGGLANHFNLGGDPLNYYGAGMYNPHSAP